MLKQTIRLVLLLLMLTIGGVITAYAQDDGVTVRGQNRNLSTGAPTFTFQTTFDGGIRRNPDGSVDIAGCVIMVVYGASNGNPPSSIIMGYTLYSNGAVVTSGSTTFNNVTVPQNVSVHLPPGTMTFGTTVDAEINLMGVNPVGQGGGSWSLALDTRQGTQSFGNGRNDGQTVTRYSTPGTFPSPTTCGFPAPTCDTAISSFTASSTNINAGQSVTLSWNTFHAITADINGTSIALPSGSMTVTPSGTTTYTLTANGPNGCPPVTQQVTVTVVSCPTVAGSSFSASPSSIIQSQSSTLTWNVPNASSISISSVGTFGPSGSILVYPNSTTTYTLTSSGPGSCSPVTLQATVNVSSQFLGSLDQADCSAIGGWVYDALQPNTPIYANIYIDGSLYQRVLANIFRSDLQAAGYGNGNHAFSVSTPNSLRNGGSHTVQVTFDNGQAIGNSPKTITGCTASGTISANPNPITVCNGTGVGQTTLNWSTSGVDTVEVRIGSPSGTLFVAGAASGSATTGQWVTDGMVFYLQNSSYGTSTSAANTLATITVNLNTGPVIGSYGASPTSINAGQSSTLSWSISGASTATITDLTSGQVFSVNASSGSLSVTPASTRTYRLTASGACTYTQDVTINVTSCQTISSYTASSTSILQGQSVTLSYALSGATSATITDLTSGVVTNVPVQSGSLVVTPATTRTYRLSATGPCATVTQDKTINVTACPTVAGSTFSATPSSINPGGSSTLSWSVPNAASVTISGVAGTFGSTGSVSVSPASSTTYTLTATGAGSCSSIQLTATVTVASCPSVAGSTFSASPSSIVQGQSSTLTWNVPNATSVTISGVAGTFGSSGSVSVTPSSTTTYTLTAAGPGTCSSIQLTAMVNVTPCPQVSGSTFSASPSSIGAGQSSTLSWNVPAATSITIAGVGTFSGSTGSATVSPSSTTTYTLTASGAAGCSPVTLQTTVTVTPCQIINALTVNGFSAEPQYVATGSSVTVAWDIANFTTASIDLYRETVFQSRTNITTNTGSFSVNVGTTYYTAFILTVNGACATQSRLFRVFTSDCPTVAGSSFSASPGSILQGQSSTLSWNVPNAQTVTISGVPGTFSSTGSVSVSPSSTTTYTLTAGGVNGCSPITMQTTVNVTACPSVSGSSFSSSPTNIGAGQSSTLTWNVPNATSVTISGVAGTFGSTGSVSVNPASTTTYTLTAAGASGCSPITLQTTVTVTPCQTINSLTVNGFSVEPQYVAQGSSVTVAWDISNFTTASIDLYREGVFQSKTNLNTNTGSFSVNTGTTYYVAFVLTVNGACAQQSRLFRVFTSACPTVAGSTFSASPTTINAGQSSTLTWNVPDATTVTISGVPGTFGSTGSVSVSPSTTTTYTLTANGVNGCSPVSLQATVNVNQVTGAVLIGPLGQPGATGPNSTNDDYTNRTLTLGFTASTGGVTTAGGAIIFRNTLQNPQSLQADTYTLRASLVPSGFTVEIDTGDGAGFVSLNGGATTTTTVAASASKNLQVRVTAPAGIAVLTGFDTVIRATSGITPANYNETIDRLWTGYIRAQKSQIVTNTTGVGGPSAAVSGAIIEYVLDYSNVTVSSGTGNADLTATNVIFTENGNTAPNNWGTTTNHVPGSASDSLGGTITGDVAGSTLIRDTVPSLAPGQSGVFKFRRVIK